MPGDSSHKRRRIPVWPFAWAGLTLLFFLVHVTFWLHTRYVVVFEPAAWLLKPIGNLVHMLTLPGWMIGHLLFQTWGESDLSISFFACVIGAGVVVCVALALLEFRALVLRRIDRRAAAPSRAVNLARRRLLADGLLLGATAGSAALLVDSTCFAPARLRLTRYTIPIRGLPPSLEGLRLAQLTDTHLGPRVSAQHIDEAIDLALGLRPDVFLLTGDYVHCGSEWINPAASQLIRLAQTNRPVVAVLGNHDWFNDGRRVARTLRDVGIPTIDNDRLFLSRLSSGKLQLDSAPDRSSLCIAGLGDLRQDHIDPDKALYAVDPAIPRLILSHNPDSAEENSITRRGAPRVDLMISGHTHGGQVRIPGVGTGAGILSRYGDKYACGLVQGPACRVLISRGVGISLVPFRFLVPPEVVEITLTRAPEEPISHTLLGAVRSISEI